MLALTKQEAPTEDRDCGTLLLVSEDTSGSKTSQESRPSVDELSTSEILSRPTSTSITNEVKEKIEVARSEDLPIDLGHVASDDSRAERLGTTEDEQICYHEGGDLYAEDVGEDMVVVSDVPLTTEEVKIEDIQLDPTSNSPEEVDRLRDGIR
ncbi:hypothetical protein PC123_g13869 [Phytophthora cactorum]|nr:hypothetical protein PC123_g13869 [Phytophthora cactorum]